MSEFLDGFLGFLEFFIPFNLFVDGKGSQVQSVSACVEDKRDRIIEFGDDLGYFEVNSAFNFFFGGSKEELVIVYPEVVLGPSREETLPQFKIPFHSGDIVYSIKYYIVTMGGLCFGEEKHEESNRKAQQKLPEIERIDQVKFKLKRARDTIKNFIAAKNRDLDQIEAKIAEKVPAFK